MKTKKFILPMTVILVIIAMVVFRLAANKSSFEKEIKMVSESNIIIPVITEEITQKEINDEFTVNGNFVASQEMAITTEIQGKVVSIAAETGDRVSSGQILATLNKEVVLAQLEVAEFNLSKAEKDLQRNEQLLKTGGATPQQYEQSKQIVMDSRATLASAKNQEDNSSIKAPFDGIITKRYIEKGSFLTSGTTLFDLVKITKIHLQVKLTAVEAQKVARNQQAKVSTEGNASVSRVGFVYSIAVKADASKRYEVEIETENPTVNPVKPGMFGTATFIGLTKKTALTISRKAIVGSIKNPEVFLVKGDSVVLQKIVIRQFNEKEYSVEEGLKKGDRVVVSGQINLVNGSKINLIK